MRLAFHAPMKPPDHPVPSGDRTIARALIQALSHLGAEAQIASRFRSRDGAGDAGVQQALLRKADGEVARILRAADTAGWDGWLTYHNYYKAPDLIGPSVSAAMGIPYLLVEATRAKKRLVGPWADFSRRAEAATDAARVVFCFSERDAVALRRDAPAGQRLVPIRPFLTTLPAPAAGGDGTAILSVGMMREGDKLKSYALIADTLARLGSRPWTLAIAGDGPARDSVARLMRPFGARVRFLGALDADAMRAAFDRADVFLWPGVNEALGMVYLEAQGAGLPVVAQHRPGMIDVLAPEEYPSVEAGAEGMAAMLAAYLDDGQARRAAGRRARAHVADSHLLDRAAKTLARGLTMAGVAA